MTSAAPVAVEQAAAPPAAPVAAEQDAAEQALPRAPPEQLLARDFVPRPADVRRHGSLARCCAAWCCSCEGQCMTRGIASMLNMLYVRHGAYSGAPKRDIPALRRALGQREDDHAVRATKLWSAGGLEGWARDLEVPAVLLPRSPAGPGGAAARVPPLWTRVVEPRGPGGAAAAGGARPIVVFFHGGGHVHGSPRSRLYTGQFRHVFSRLGGCYIVAPAYAKAPEQPFPGAVLDCYDAVRWVASAASHALLPPGKADRRRVVLMGDSAGGNLVLAVATLVRDGLCADLSPAPAEMAALRVVCVAPQFPMCYLGTQTVSNRDNRDAFLLPDWHLEFYSEAYLGTEPVLKAARLKDRRLAPLQAPLAGLPPVVLLSGGKDPFRDENEILARALRDAAVPVTHVHGAKGVHVFTSFPLEPEAGTKLSEFLGAVARAVSEAAPAAEPAASEQAKEGGKRGAVTLPNDAP